MAGDAIPSVRLETAFAWRCRVCCGRNFVEAVEVRFETEYERREALINVGVIGEFDPTPPHEAREFLQAPDVVQCSRCRRSFSVEEGA